jgi:hypothetical protein
MQLAVGSALSFSEVTIQRVRPAITVNSQSPLRTFRWGAFGDDGYEELDAWVAFRLGLKTWANWVDANIDPNATRVFFMSISTTHMRQQLIVHQLSLHSSSSFRISIALN